MKAVEGAVIIPGNDDNDGNTGLRLVASAPATASEPLAALATIVRTLGVIGGADRAERAVLDGWARHIETGAAPPGTRRRAAPVDVDADPDDRDWTGLCGAVTRSLEHRAAACARTLEDLQTQLAVARQDRREQEDRDVMDDLSIREHTRQLARAADRDDAVALRALVHEATAKLMVLLDERCARRNDSSLDDLDQGGALVDEFDDDDEPTVPALRSPLAADRAAADRAAADRAAVDRAAVDHVAVTRWRQ